MDTRFPYVTKLTNNSIETKNSVNDAQGGYEGVVEYIPIAQPGAKVLRQLDELEPSDDYGDGARLKLSCSGNPSSHNVV